MTQLFEKRSYSVGILAGGKSTRMGSNKALLEFQNETLLGRLTRRFAGSDLMVSASGKGIYEAAGARFVYDEIKVTGPIEGIRQLLLNAKEEYVFVCAVDMPFVDIDVAEYLAQFISSDYDCYVLADEDRIHPLCAIYSKKALPAIEALIREGKYCLRAIFDRVRTKFIDIRLSALDRKAVKNINTKDEFRALSLPVIFAVSGYHNSGKTWLIERLINEFKGAGYSVGVIKHDGNDHISEAEGTDTKRCMAAGAVSTAVFSESGYLISSHRAVDEKRLIEHMKAETPPPDIIILEGFKHTAYPKLELVRKEIHPESVADKDSLICLVSDILSPETVSCPVFGPDEVKGIFLCLLDHFGMEKNQ